MTTSEDRTLKSLEKRKNKKKGDAGEAFARAYLCSKNWTILAAPFRCQSGEIDIVAMDGTTLVFVEVKARATNEYGDPVMAVNRLKQKKIIKTARVFMTFYNTTEFMWCRFDIMGLTRQKDSNEFTINHIQDAFRLEPGDMAFSY